MKYVPRRESRSAKEQVLCGTPAAVIAFAAFIALGILVVAILL